MNARISDAGTKYLARSLYSLRGPILTGIWILRLIMPSRHLRLASNTPDPEFPVLATSLITVPNFERSVWGSSCGDMMCDLAVLSGIATMTVSPGHGAISHIDNRRICRLIGNLSWSTASNVRSTSAKDPSLMTFAERSRPAISTLGRVKKDLPTTCAAVMT